MEEAHVYPHALRSLGPYGRGHIETFTTSPKSSARQA